MATISPARPASAAEPGTSSRAWLALLGASLCMFCGQPAVVLFTFGVFAPEIAAATRWSPQAIAAAIAPGTILAALLAPLAGAGVDRFGARRMAIIGGPAFALGFLIVGMAANSATAFVALMALMCALGFAATPVIYAQVVSGWFAQRRGLALSVMFSCSSLGVAVWPPYAAYLLQSGWRFAYPVMGATAGAIILLAAVLFLREAPRMAPAVDAPPAVPGLTMREALRTAVFWKFVAIFVLVTAALGGTAVNLPVILRAGGFTTQEGALAVSVVGIAMLVGRLSIGLLLDRFHAPVVTAAYCALGLVAFAWLLVDRSPASFLVAAAALGLGFGAELNAAAFMTSRAFGLRAFGGVYGAITTACGLGSALGPALVGAALAGGVDLSRIFVTALALLCGSIALLLTIRPRDLPFGPPPAK